MHFPKTLTPTHRAGSHLASVGSVTPLSLGLLDGGHRDGKTENSGAKN
jgi:hypothetical protein